MNCAGCSNPDRGIVIADCLACVLRDIARGPHFFQSMRHGKLTPEYLAQIRPLGDLKQVHESVKAAAKALHTGAVA